MRESVRPGVSMPPVICMSAQFDDTTLNRLAAAGATDLLTKDSDVITFASRVLTSFALNQQQAQRGWGPGSANAIEGLRSR